MFTDIKNKFIASLDLFFKTVKNNFVRLAFVFAVYCGSIIFSAKYFNPFFAGASNVLITLFLLSLISVSSPLFEGREFKMSNLFPGWKFILYSLFAAFVVFIFFIPLKMLILASNDTVFSYFLPAAAAFICKILLDAVMVLFAFIAIFAAFDFNRKPSIDDPVINSFKLLLSNKLLLYFFALIYVVLVSCVQRFSEVKEIIYILYMFFSPFLMAVYYVLRLKDEDIPVKKEPEEDGMPNMKISF
ncbi:MAG: hypothetical protein FWH43_00950 [Endomicrobia bacterium]|nr:hypothetical protein [Endomicrobiia bacterium]